MWSPSLSLAQRKSAVPVPPDDYGPAQPMTAIAERGGLLPWADEEVILSRSAVDGEVAVATA
jgi:hypothetical protein